MNIEKAIEFLVQSQARADARADCTNGAGPTIQGVQASQSSP